MSAEADNAAFQRTSIWAPITELQGRATDESKMPRMTPDWLHQVLWYISGVLATGAVWYFLSQKNFRATVWSAYFAIVIALLAVALIVRNDVIRREREASTLITASVASPPFLLRYHTALIANFPGPLVYVYDSKGGKRIAPVGYAVVLEVVNSRAMATKVHEYTLDVAVGNEWVRVYNLQPLNFDQFYWVAGNDRESCTRLDFTQTSFDVQARDKSLKPGDSIRGWMFFEWPPELRSNSAPQVSKLRVHLEDAQGERQMLIVDSAQPQDAGISLLSGGAWFVPPQQLKTDLSGIPILPHMDLLRDFKQIPRE